MPIPESNLLLEKLPPDLRARLLSEAERVILPIRSSLYHPGQLPKFMHFITSGIASVVTTMATGDSVEIALNGRESAAECLHLLGPERGSVECFVQVDSTALRIDFKRFQDEFSTIEPLRRMLLRNIQYQTLITGQIAACNRLHDVEERLARWLLMVSDRLGEPRFRLTQEFLAEMIGSRRSTVTITAGILKRSGFINYQRGDVHIVDRKSLEDIACECYHVTARLLQNFRADVARLGKANGSLA